MMRSRQIFRPLFVLVALLAGLTTAVQAAVPNRIGSAVSDAQISQIEGSTPAMTTRSVDQGRLGSTESLTAMTINFLPSATQQAAIQALLQAQQQPASPNYHKWLTPAQYGAQFGMSDADLNQVSAWLQSKGFSVDAVVPSRNAIRFSGTSAQAEEAFHTELHTYLLNGESHFSNATPINLPAAFAATVSSIGGLNNFGPRSHLQQSGRSVPLAVKSAGAPAGVAANPHATDGKGDEFLAPEDFAKIYDVKALYNAGINGSASYPIGIIGQTAILPADISDFRSSLGLSVNAPTLVLVPGTGASAVTSTDDMQESDLDLEWSGAVAPSAPIYFIYTGNTKTGSSYTYGVFDSLQYAIQTYVVGSKSIPVLSISYGRCESAYGASASAFTAFEQLFQQANLQGQTIISAAGDTGAADCDDPTTAANSYVATQGLAVDYPSSSAYVTGLGGSSFSGDLSAQSTYWGSTNDANLGNELGLYIPSSVWDNTPTAATALTLTGLSAGGGGVSAFFAKPTWQGGAPGIPADGKRDVPDISLSADPNHDGYVVCSNLSCEGASAGYDIFGGTSVAAPSFAGILALVEQKVGAAQGNINPRLYALASTSATYGVAFHDITTGSNIVPCTAGSTGCVGGLLGYNAGTGYDTASGLGSVDAFNLANVFSSAVVETNSSLALAYTPTAPQTGQSVTFTATVTPSAGTTVPTGTVVFVVDGAASGASETVNATGVASFTTTFTTAGTHAVNAAYSGDSTYYPSTAATNLQVTVASSSTNAATTTTLTASPTTTTVGSTLKLTANVSSTVTGTLGAATVVFSSGTTQLGTAVLSVTGDTGVASTSITVAAASLPVGSDTITASFPGGGTNTNGGSYIASSGSTVVVVSNPQITLSASPSSQTIASGGTVTSTITVTSAGGYTGTVTLSSPSISGYTFTPATVAISTAGGSGTSVFTVTGVTAASKSGGTFTHSTGISSLLVGGGASLAGLFLFGLTGLRRRRWATLFSLLVFSAIAAGMGCSSSSNTGGSTTPVTGTITIVGTDSTNSLITGSTNITVTVQ